MKRILLAISLLLTPTVSQASHCALFETLTASQQHVLQESYAGGAPLDLGFTLAAIALQESSAGNHRVNWGDPSFGVHHIYMKTAASTLEVQEGIPQVLLALRLAVDDDMNREMALGVLTYWRERHSGDWERMVMSYNAGNKFWNGRGYLTRISRHVRQLQQCKVELTS